MKIQCDVCQAAAAEVVCCTEEAALCGGCDLINHAGNTMATNHQRLPLSAAALRPRCDTCQETLGWFFCLEDRVVLCRQCDISTHKSRPFGSGHHRLLLTNVKVGLDPKQSTTTIKFTQFSQMN
ncbi:hypothetical protein ABFS83_05G080200 [Erythranthe nasuta]